MSSLCEEPNPLGDEILFYSSDGTESFRKLVEASRRATATSNAIKNQKIRIMDSDDIHHDIQNDIDNDYIDNDSNSIDSGKYNDDFNRLLRHIDNDSNSKCSNNKNNNNSENNDNNNNKNNKNKNKYNNLNSENLNDTSDDVLPDFNGSLTARQQQKFLLNYAVEADELANDAADRLRMSYKIGKPLLRFMEFQFFVTVL